MSEEYNLGFDHGFEKGYHEGLREGCMKDFEHRTRQMQQMQLQIEALSKYASEMDLLKPIQIVLTAEQSKQIDLSGIRKKE